jgi:hypothetical protein
MAKSNSTDYCGSLTDDDSGIGRNYSSSNDLNSSTSTLIESSPSYISPLRISSPLSAPLTTTIKKQFNGVPLVKVASDGIIERIRPATMKNSQNGDFILCRTNRGTYVAHRTPDVPEWITRLVKEIESQQQ